MHSAFIAPHNGKTVVVIVFHGNALERLQANDPAVVTGDNLLEVLESEIIITRSLDLIFCYEADRDAFLAEANKVGDPTKLLEWLCRGWKNDKDELATKRRTVNKTIIKKKAPG